MELPPQHKRRATVRWLWIAPNAILVWYGMLALAMALQSLATKFCPAEALLADYCAAAWFHAVERGITIGCAGLTALAIVVVAAVTAPMYRLRAAVAAFVVGMALALNMVAQTSAYAEFAAAVVGGLLGVFVASRLQQTAEL